MNRKVGIYSRVSPTSEESRENETIEDQVEKLTKLIARNEDILVEIYQDDGWTGKAERRPDFDRLLEDARIGKINTVYITKVDRLARSEGARIYCLKELKKSNLEVFIGGELIDNTSEGKLMIRILGSFAEFEAEQIVLRTTNGRWRSARDGKIIASVARFGYRLEWIQKGEEMVKIVAIDENESKIVLYMFDLVFKLRSCHQVAKKLLEEDIKTRHGKNWDATTVKGVLTDKTYTGIWHYGKRLAVEPKKKKKTYYKCLNSSTMANPNKEDIIYYKIPAIVSEEKFNAIRELLKEISKRRVTTKRFWLLNGILRCAKCGAKMYGRNAYDKRYNRDYMYYYCSTNSKPFHKNPCPTRQVRAKDVEKLVWELVQNIFHDPEKVLSCNETYLKENYNRSKIANDKRLLLAELEKIRQNKIKQLELYEADDVMDKAIVKERLNFWSGKEQDIKKKLEVFEKSATDSEINRRIIENIKDYGEKMEIDLEKMSNEEKKELLMGMLVYVEFDQDSGGVNVVGSVEGIDSTNLPGEKVKVLKLLVL